MRIKKWKKKYDESLIMQLSMYAISDKFRCMEILVRDCCWQCATFTMKFIFPNKEGELDIDSFLEFCLKNKINANSFEIALNRPTLEFLTKEASRIRGDN